MAAKRRGSNRRERAGTLKIQVSALERDCYARLASLLGASALSSWTRRLIAEAVGRLNAAERQRLGHDRLASLARLIGEWEQLEVAGTRPTIGRAALPVDPVKDGRDLRLKLRVTPEEKAVLLDASARLHGPGLLSFWVRGLLLDEAARLLRSDRDRLPPDLAEGIEEILRERPAVEARARRAATRHRPQHLRRDVPAGCAAARAGKASLHACLTALARLGVALAPELVASCRAAGIALRGAMVPARTDTAEAVRAEVGRHQDSLRSTGQVLWHIVREPVADEIRDEVIRVALCQLTRATAEISRAGGPVR